MSLHEDRTCSCGGTLKFSENFFILTRAERLTAVEGWLHADLYCCEACGKMEFYKPKRETEADKLENLYRKYPDKKLRKIIESKEYREDAKDLARQILEERAEMSSGE